MRRFTKVFSAMFAVIMLFTGLPQASAVEEQTADPKSRSRRAASRWISVCPRMKR